MNLPAMHGPSAPSLSSQSSDQHELNEAQTRDLPDLSKIQSGTKDHNPSSDFHVPSESNSAQSLLGYSPDIDRLQSALRAIEPSSDLKTSAYHYIAPMAKAALEFPEAAEPLRELACQWSCGELHDGKHPGLLAITRKGLTGKALFNEVWTFFMTDKSYTGPRRSLGSVYHVAKAAGWTYP